MFDRLRQRFLDVVRRGRTKTTTRTIVFADIVGSTALYESLGYVRAREMVGERLEQMRIIVRREGGRVVKSLGDGLLSVFAEPSPAISAAMEITHGTDDALPIHASLHLGEVLSVGNDVFGDTVNTAARIAELAKANEVLISRTVLDAMPAGYRRLVRPVQPVEIKGKQDPLELFAAVRLGQRDEVATIPTEGISALTLAARSAVRLRWRDQELRVDEDRPRITLGRAEENDVFVDTPSASRSHAWIEVRGGRVTLGDQSSNGTLLVTGDGRNLKVHRDRTPLIGAGRIYLGHTPDAGDDGIEFQVVD